MDLCEDREYPVGYAIRAKGTGKLESECQKAYESCDHLDDFTYTADNPFFGEIRNQMSHSEKTRRVCFKLFFTEDEKDQTQLLLIPRIFAVITNIEEMNPEQVINFYCQRGNRKNFIKELKNDFFANTLSHKSFAANAFDFFLKSLAYNLFRFFQFCVLEGSDQKMTAGSFRKKYQKVASRLGFHSRCFHLKIAKTFAMLPGLFVICERPEVFDGFQIRFNSAKQPEFFWAVSRLSFRRVQNAIIFISQTLFDRPSLIFTI